MSDLGSHKDPKGVWDRPHDPSRFQKIELPKPEPYWLDIAILEGIAVVAVAGILAVMWLVS